ncbi:MAG TPA: TrkA C-terminal domain-containing protein [Polyangiales bacterium]|nr:TrkA C-terminal domain-containing protein [Polyangiales bacterium]
MQALATILSRHELLALALVIWLGLLLGRVNLRGLQLGAAGVLFAGLGLSALLAPYATLKASPAVKELGLVLFVYCVGLSSAAGFFSAFRQRGARWNVIVLFALLVGAGVAVGVGHLLRLNPGQITGVFCGALTNTPALAAATDRLQATPFAEHPALGYSAAYPFGVLGALLIFRAFAYVRQSKRQQKLTSAAPRRPLLTRNFEVQNREACFKSLDELDVRNTPGVVISRIHRTGRLAPDGRDPSADHRSPALRGGSSSELLVATGASRLEPGDVIVAVGDSDALERAQTFFGAVSDRDLEAGREHVDMRRILVSRHELVGRTLGEIDLDVRFNGQVTRLRRADVDLLASDDTRLELGDRLRVVAPKDNLAEIAKFFGDSERELAEIDFVALALGLAAGFVLSIIPPWPGSTLRLGIAGPLLVALFLGRVVRTGNLVWVLPYETSNVLRHFGLLVFLAAVGIGSGSQLTSLFGREGLALAGLGALVTLVFNLLLLGLLAGPGRASPAEALGGCSGAQTQPATLAVARDLTGGADEVNVAYAVVYPTAMIAKIVLAQVIAMLPWL